MDPGQRHLDFKAIALLVLLCASWGLQQISIKVAITGIPPVMQAGIRSLGATLLVFIWMRMRRIHILNVDGTLWWGISIGLLFSIEFILIYKGLAFISASRAVIFMYTMPFFTTLGAHWLIPGERLGPGQAIGLGCAFLGIVAAFSESMGFPDARMLIGDTMLLVSALLWATVTVMIKTGPLSQIKPSKVLLYQLSISALVLPVFSIVMGETGVTLLNLPIVGCLFYQAVWVAFITYLAWFWMINVYPASRLSAFLFLTPLLGVLEGALLLNEALSRNMLLALTMVSIGIYMVNRR